jgi:hypothetical protein
MRHLVTPYGTFSLIQYDTQKEFERAIGAHVNDIFGERQVRATRTPKGRSPALLNS